MNKNNNKTKKNRKFKKINCGPIKRNKTLKHSCFDDDTLFYSSGFHYVNRLGFIVTEKEYEGVIDIQVE